MFMEHEGEIDERGRFTPSGFILNRTGNHIRSLQTSLYQSYLLLFM